MVRIKQDLGHPKNRIFVCELLNRDNLSVNQKRLLKGICLKGYSY
jgi:hypothetical protein